MGFDEGLKTVNSEARAVLLLPGIITLSAYVMSVGGGMMQLGAGDYFYSGGITAVFRMIAELLVQALIICQGYLCGCMRRSAVERALER